MKYIPNPLSIALAISALGILALALIEVARPPDIAKRLFASAPETPTAAAVLSAAPAATAIPPTPTPLHTSTPLPAPSPTPSYAPVASSVALDGIRHEWQTWNNCGPATLAMNLSFYGSPLDQAAIGDALRTHEDDKNVGPGELVDYARSQGYLAELRVGGSAELLRRLLSNGIPVLVETWYEPEGGPVSADGLGHYRLLAGYDDASQYWIAFDSLSYSDALPGDTYRGIRVTYADFDRYWQVFNRTYLLIYPPAQDAFVRGLLGAATDASAMWPAAYAEAQAAVAAAPDDGIAWFNLGADALQVGNAAEAAAAFDRARALGLPPRLLWYEYAPLAAYYAAGRYADVLAVTDEVFAETESVEDVHYWRGMALAALGRVEEARAAWQRALELNPRFLPAQAALAGA